MAEQIENTQQNIIEIEDDQYVSPDHRRIYVFGNISDEIGLRTIQKIQRLSTQPGPIYMYISSDGGDIDPCMAIIDQMSVCPCDIITIVVGRACSAAAIIAEFGIKRYIMPNAFMMFHPIYYCSGEDYVDQQTKIAKFSSEQYDNALSILGKKLRRSTQKLRQLFDKGLWLNSKEAIKQKFVDGLWTKELETQAINSVSSEKSNRAFMELLRLFINKMYPSETRG